MGTKEITFPLMLTRSNISTRNIFVVLIDNFGGTEFKILLKELDKATECACSVDGRLNPLADLALCDGMVFNNKTQGIYIPSINKINDIGIDCIREFFIKAFELVPDILGFVELRGDYN